MSEFTSTIEGFQRAMQESLDGKAEDTERFAASFVTPDFYHVMNDVRSEFDAYVKATSEWRGKVSEYRPKVTEFLRDGDQLAARMIGTIKVAGHDTKFESFIFGRVHQNGKMQWMIERSVWGPVDGPHEHGVN